MINEFIEKIIIYEGVKNGYERTQKVDIYLNFIGKFEPPPQELTDEEKKELHKKKVKLECNRRYRERQREKKRKEVAN